MKGQNKFRRKKIKPIKELKRAGDPRIGDVSRSPVITMGLQAPMYRTLRIQTYTRVLKYESFISTVAAQTFLQNSYYIYTPYAKATATSGSVTVNSGAGASLADLYAVFAFFRVRKIAICYTSVQSTLLALPPIYCALMPETSPNNLGTVANTMLVSSFANSLVIDPHESCSFTYRIPPPSSVSYIGANTMVGGWLPSAGQVGPVSTNPGIIAFSCGDSIFAPPVNTTLGTLLIEYVMDFRAAE